MAVSGKAMCVNASRSPVAQFPDRLFRPLLSEETGTLAGCVCGILEYTNSAYELDGIHEDQEVFYVLEGSGEARVGDETFPLSQGDCLYIPPHVRHAVRRSKEHPSLRLFFFHAAV